jgi:hypothetical protein
MRIVIYVLLLMIVYIYYKMYMKSSLNEGFLLKNIYEEKSKPYTVERLPQCLKTYPSNVGLTFDKIPTQYYNKYYRKNMDLLLCDFYIAGSYKSYIPCGYTNDIQSVEAIKMALKLGARILTFDLYSQGEDLSKPAIVCRVESPMGGDWNQAIPFEDICKTVMEYGWNDGINYPLLLYFNIHFEDQFLYQQMARTILNVFSARLANKKYGFKRSPIGQIRISELLGTVLIITNKYPMNGMLNEHINEAISEEHQTTKMIEYTKANMEYGGLSATVSNGKQMIENNKYNLTFVYHEPDQNYGNIIQYKSDIENYDFQDVFNYGCQSALMYYGVDDDEMKKYLEYFKNCSFVIKPDKLRYIPQPPPKIKKQDERLSYKPKTNIYPGMDGFPWLTNKY